MERQVRYCTTEDGIRIAYCVEGEGPPIFFIHYVYSFSLSHMVPSYENALQQIGRGRQLIRYDMRGTGLSQRDDIPDLSPDAHVKDVEAVADALGLTQFTLLGASSGGPRAVQYAASHPDKVKELILYESYACLEEMFPSEMMTTFAMFARANWKFATRTLSDVSVRIQDPTEAQRWTTMMHDSTTGETMARLVESHVGLDVSDLLPTIQCPTLVCHSRNDLQWPFMLGQRLAEGIPNARLVTLDGDQTGAFTNPEAAIAAIEEFLSELAPGNDATATAASDDSQKPLTQRETEILQLIAAGMTSKEISGHLSLSIRTVGRHITNIYDKIGARGRADATAYALRHGLAEE